MHIPEHMVNGPICPVTAGLAIAGIAAAAFFAVKSKDKPAALKFAAVTSLIFAAQMLNFPVLDGTSGHMIGVTLAVLALGAPFGVISMAIVLAVQTLLFADGGLMVLGTNILNMALVASIPGIILGFILKNEKISGNIPLKLGLVVFASWLSTVLASIACAVELGVSGAIALSAALPAMLSVHLLIGIGEGILTGAFAAMFENRTVRRSAKLSFALPLASAGVIALVLSPFASALPDGLEWAAAKFNALHDAAPLFVAPIADYAAPFLSDPVLSASAAGLIGIAAVFAVSILTGLIFNPKPAAVKA
ncbi:MAG: hypothetical protein A2Y33_13740 [Spirochaetes bacterium GWF1_51_8]|nr:MAG: hypothetical protein A2Y33_13740 [Spirochaetes bacterium GWF1_51_8]